MADVARFGLSGLGLDPVRWGSVWLGVAGSVDSESECFGSLRSG
jgi:hypothetical protein